MGPSLAVALFILCADGQVFDQWSTIDDALECMGHAETAVQPAPLTGNVNNHSALGTAPQRRHKRSMHDGVKNGHAEQNEMTVPEEAAGQGRKRKQPAQQPMLVIEIVALRQGCRPLVGQVDDRRTGCTHGFTIPGVVGAAWSDWVVTSVWWTR